MPVYLKYGKIKGEVQEPAHRGWIELMSVQLGVSRKVTTGRERASSDISEITVTKEQDSASALLFNESLVGKGTDVVIDFVGEDGSVYLRLELSQTMISSYSFSSGGDRPTESFSLNFTKLKYTYTPGTPPP